MSNIEDIIAAKQLADLEAEKAKSNPYPEVVTDNQVEEVLKYLKYQQGGKEADGMDEYMGFGDRKIAMKVGVSLSQIRRIKAARDAKIRLEQDKLNK